MAATLDCTPSCCATVPPVAIPGVEGDPGLDGDPGTNGVSAYTVTTDDFVLPAVNANVTVDVVSTLWMVVGEKIFIGDGTDQGTFEVVTIPNSTQVQLKFLGYPDDSAPAATIDTGAGVTPTGTLPVFTLPAQLTDNSTGSASDTIATLINQRFVVMSFPILLTSLDTPADLVTDFVLPFKGAILSWQFIDEVVATSGGTADAVLELQIGATPVTGSPTTITQADFAAIGQRKAGGTITAANTFAASAIFSIVCTASAVNFTAGKINAYVTFSVREDALNDAIASLAAKVNAIIVATS